MPLEWGTMLQVPDTEDMDILEQIAELE